MRKKNGTRCSRWSPSCCKGKLYSQVLHLYVQLNYRRGLKSRHLPLQYSLLKYDPHAHPKADTYTATHFSVLESHRGNIRQSKSTWHILAKHENIRPQNFVERFLACVLERERERKTNHYVLSMLLGCCFNPSEFPGAGADACNGQSTPGQSQPRRWTWKASSNCCRKLEARPITDSKSSPPQPGYELQLSVLSYHSIIHLKRSCISFWCWPRPGNMSRLHRSGFASTALQKKLGLARQH